MRTLRALLLAFFGEHQAIALTPSDEQPHKFEPISVQVEVGGYLHHAGLGDDADLRERARRRHLEQRRPLGREPRRAVEQSTGGKGVTILHLKGVIDAHTYHQLTKTIEDLFEQDSFKIVLDLNDIERLFQNNEPVCLSDHRS